MNNGIAILMLQFIRIGYVLSQMYFLSFFRKTKSEIGIKNIGPCPQVCPILSLHRLIPDISIMSSTIVTIQPESSVTITVQYKLYTVTISCNYTAMSHQYNSSTYCNYTARDKGG